eukprot:9502708-Pyramimonas_sp.AAC.1
MAPEILALCRRRASVVWWACGLTSCYRPRPCCRRRTGGCRRVGRWYWSELDVVSAVGSQLLRYVSVLVRSCDLPLRSSQSICKLSREGPSFATV